MKTPHHAVCVMKKLYDETCIMETPHHVTCVMKALCHEIPA